MESASSATATLQEVVRSVKGAVVITGIRDGALRHQG